MSIFDREVTPLEPFDPATPRLTFEEVRELVAALNVSTLTALSAGPREEAGQCRLCDALISQEDLNGSRKSEIAVDLLRAWHDNIDLPPVLMDGIYGRDRCRPVPVTIDDARHGILGPLAYARCTTVYALAQVELAYRWTKP